MILITPTIISLFELSWTENMSLTRSYSVQGGILKVWCMISVVSCLVKADQYDKSFDPFTRRTLTADGGHGGGPGGGHGDGTCPNYKVIDVSKYANAKGDGKTDDTAVRHCLNYYLKRRMFGVLSYFKIDWSLFSRLSLLHGKMFVLALQQQNY